jgi:hypothetical protein
MPHRPQRERRHRSPVRALVLAVCLTACSSKPTLSSARRLENGTDTPRDYRAAVALERDLCAGGGGELAACDAYLWNVRSNVGDLYNMTRDMPIAHGACARGDLFACEEAHDPPALDGDDLQRMCDRGDGHACATLAMDDHTEALENPKDARMAQLALASARRACRVGGDPREKLLCGDVVARGGDGDARAKLDGACDDGDAEACAQLPGRAIPASELCAAGAAGACPRARARPPFIDFQF